MSVKTTIASGLLLTSWLVSTAQAQDYMPTYVYGTASGADVLYPHSTFVVQPLVPQPYGFSYGVYPFSVRPYPSLYDYRYGFHGGFGTGLRSRYGEGFYGGWR